MICPICGSFCDDDLRYCDVCGANLLSHQEEISTIQVIETPSTQLEEKAPVPHTHIDSIINKGRLWPPLLTMIVMICIGTLLFFFVPTGNFAPETNASTAWFSVENGVLSFHEEYYHGSAELTIPTVVDGQTVTAIADYAFSGSDSISTVIIPETVSHIGDYAFSSCKNIRGVYIPSSVHSIGVYAFADCDRLEAIYFPGTLESIGHGVLDSCNNLHYILYNGTYRQWTNLYSGYFVTTVELHTTDGVYYTQP